MDDDICSCPCHDPRGELHAYPCCSHCPTCGLNIRFSVWAAHVDHHIKTGPKPAPAFKEPANG